MSTVLTAFTLQGVALALRLRDLLGEGQVWTKEKFKEKLIKDYQSVKKRYQDKYEGYKLYQKIMR